MGAPTMKLYICAAPMVRACIVAAVFLSGAAVMSLEMAGFRLIMPESSSDIVVWGSLISVFLGGLALGAWAGGRLADIRPALWKLGVLLAAAGFVALTIPFYSDAALQRMFPETAPLPVEWKTQGTKGPSMIVPNEDLRWPALAAGAMLFGIPTLLLGMVTPYAVKLLVDAIPRLGSGVGRISGISTLGAILGTLGTAFYLIEWMGTRRIIRLNGVLLVALGVTLIFADRLARRAKC